MISTQFAIKSGNSLLKNTRKKCHESVAIVSSEPVEEVEASSDLFSAGVEVEAVEEVEEEPEFEGVEGAEGVEEEVVVRV